MLSSKEIKLVFSNLLFTQKPLLPSIVIVLEALYGEYILFHLGDGILHNDKMGLSIHKEQKCL